MKTTKKTQLWMLLAGVVLGVGGRAHAQGCVAARMDSPVPGSGSSIGGAGSWDVFFNWRYFRSDRHFVGSEEQVQREQEGSQVINWVNQATLSARYNFTERTNVTVSAPYFMMERSNPIRDEKRVVVDRSRTHASGLGDVTITARRWMLDAHSHQRGNVSLGFGVKLPTGESSVVDSFRVRKADGEIVQEVRPVDQSIQPGDGAFGFSLDFQGYAKLRPALSAYGSAAYLFNPRETSFLQNGASSYWSVNDQYIVRSGVSYDPTGKPFGVGFGVRMDGVKAIDLLGSSEGRRRPGYAVSIDPSLRYSRGANTFDMSVPIAVYRNRTWSLDDKRRGRNGDAAFADYNLVFGVSRHF